MSAGDSRLLKVYGKLLDAYGPQGWWPSESPFETMLGAVLTQHTAWRNAERALAALRARGPLTPERIASADEGELATVVRPAGSFSRKARTLKALVDAVGRSSPGLDRVLSLERAPLRTLLLGVNGVGPETADAIMLYAAAVPAFVVDAYTRRFAARHRIVTGGTYMEIQSTFEAALPADAGLFAEYHALLVRLGKERCRPRPRCSGCPLEHDLPAQHRAPEGSHRKRRV
jgi:endonuclease-3 related protein